MNGNAETRDGMARKLVNTLKVGSLYSTAQIGAMIGNKTMQGGVIPKDDAQILFLYLTEKEIDKMFKNCLW